MPLRYPSSQWDPGSVTLAGTATVTLGTLIAGEDVPNDVHKVEQRYGYTTFTSASTLAVKSAAGFLHRIIIGMPSCPTIIAYDSAVPSGTELFRLAAGYPMGSHAFNISFTTGFSLDAIKSGGGAAPYFTISSR